MKPDETNRTISSAKSRDKILRAQKFNLPMAKNSVHENYEQNL